MAVKNKRPGQQNGSNDPFVTRPFGEGESVCVCVGLFLGCWSVSKHQEPTTNRGKLTADFRRLTQILILMPFGHIQNQSPKNAAHLIPYVMSFTFTKETKKLNIWPVWPDIDLR